MNDKVIHILLAALGGEGGGVLMNWIVAVARRAGHVVQATSVPGVAQRTGSTSYYVEVAPKSAPGSVLGLMPMPGRVDVLVSSELVETARLLEAGFVSPDRTMVISSTTRFFTNAEKIELGDGRYPGANVRSALEVMAQESFLLDLGRLANDNRTFVSATMFGALSGSGVLPWPLELSREILADEHSRAGFDASASAVKTLKADHAEPAAARSMAEPEQDFAHLPVDLREIVKRGCERTEDYQDKAYRDLFRERSQGLIDAADLEDHRALDAVTEAIRRLALWMTYEDVARVADLKTRSERFERVRKDVRLVSGQIFQVTEFMKPRAEEIADILPQTLGRRIMARARRGGWFPFLGKALQIHSNGITGYWLLRFLATMRHVRRRSLRFAEEQAAIEEWMSAMKIVLQRAPQFALGLAELPRVLKGYSDTLMRGRRACERIMTVIVRPAIESGTEKQHAENLRNAIGAALADESHAKLDALLACIKRETTVSDRAVKA